MPFEHQIFSVDSEMPKSNVYTCPLRKVPYVCTVVVSFILDCLKGRYSTVNMSVEVDQINAFRRCPNSTWVGLEVTLREREESVVSDLLQLVSLSITESTCWEYLVLLWCYRRNVILLGCRATYLLELLHEGFLWMFRQSSHPLRLWIVFLKPQTIVVLKLSNNYLPL